MLIHAKNRIDVTLSEAAKNFCKLQPGQCRDLVRHSAVHEFQI